MKVNQRKQRSLFEANVRNLRIVLRKRMELFAMSHRGCEKRRGCGCQIDKVLDLLGETEAKLFNMEILSYATPTHGGYDHYAPGSASRDTFVLPAEINQERKLGVEDREN